MSTLGSLVIFPQGLSARQWCDLMSLNLHGFGILPAITRDEDWKQWAYVACSIRQISNNLPPNPDSFKKWDEWATRFIQCLQ